MVHSSIKLFADDTKLYSIVDTPHGSSSLQADLESLAKWSNTWQLPFNEVKCKVLHLGRNNPNSQYVMRGSALSEEQVKKDSGAHIDRELSSISTPQRPACVT